MQFSSILIAAVSLALAQAKISFTTLPSEVKAGQPTTLKWAGGEDDEPVTITLRKGESSNLQTIAIITSNAKGNSFTWTPNKSLANADDYALEISQGVDDSNYTGQITLSGGSSAAASSYAISSAASTSASASASSASASASVTSETTIVLSANSTTSRSYTVYLTGTAPIGTGASASGTGAHVTRNTTFSSATPTRSTSGGGLIATTTGEATTTSGSGSSATSQAASASSSGAASRLDLQVGAGLAAVLGLAAML